MTLRILDDRTTRKVSANGLELACQVYTPEGRPADAAIVLIRGLGTQLIEWSPVLIESLVAGGLTVVIFDNRDVGLSSRLEHDYALTDMADDVVALMAALGEERFHVFGISLGGMIAQLVAVQHPDAVLCLFSVMSHSGNPELPRPSKAVWERMMLTAATREGLIELDAENRVVWGSPGYPESEALRQAMAAPPEESAGADTGPVDLGALEADSLGPSDEATLGSLEEDPLGALEEDPFSLGGEDDDGMSPGAADADAEHIDSLQRLETRQGVDLRGRDGNDGREELRLPQPGDR